MLSVVSEEVDQRLTWTKLLDGISTTGIEVYFKASVTGDVERDECKHTLQLLFDSNAQVFQRGFNAAMYGETTEELKPETGTFLLEPMKRPIGFTAAAAGCVSFIVIVAMSVCYANKKEELEVKDLSKTSIADENDNVAPKQLGFPVQQANLQENWDNVSSVL